MKIQMMSAMATVAILLCSACAVNPVTGKKELMLISEDQEIQMGKQADPSIVAAYGLYPNEQLQEFINIKGQEMAAVSHRSHLDYEFKILDSPVVNAFAVPGGYVYFTRGILAHFNTEAEFAGVLGHEIGHITARHSTNQLSKQYLFQGLFIAGLVVSPEFAQFADAAQQGLGLLFLKFGRDDESQSDKLGVEYSTKVGYDAYEMADFFQTLSRMRDESGSTIPTFLSTHPDPLDRYQKVRAEAQAWQSKVDQEQFNINRNSYLRMVEGLVYGEDPRQGFREDDVFYHPELKFYFPVPAGWQLANSPSQVQMAPEDGNALIMLSLAEQSTPNDAAQATVSENNLTVIDKKSVTVHGFPAVVMLSQQQNPQNPDNVLQILSYFIQDAELIYKFHGLSLRDNFSTYRARFEDTMGGFRRLTDQDKLNRQPERLQVRQTGSQGSVRSALAALGVPEDRLEEFAVLNGLDLDDQVSAGTLLKVL
jgi:predicted Zn-dependent protease